MGFIIWYKVKLHEQTSDGGLLSQVASALPFGTALPFSVSNDVLSGSKYILDADITLTMVEGAKASSFTITFTNLPADVTDKLIKKQAEGMKQCQPLLVDIYLGYFGETPDKPVMVGAVTSIKNAADQQSSLPKTVVQGYELGAFKLRTKYDFTRSWPKVTPDQVVQELLKGTGVTLTKNSRLDIQPQPLEKYTLPGANDPNIKLSALEILGNLTDDKSRKISIPVVVIDNTLSIGPSVGSDPVPPISFNPGSNLISIDQKQETDENRDLCQSIPVTNCQLTTLGDPDLRVGQAAVLDIASPPDGTLRITNLTHKFSTTNGYTCDMTVSVVEPGKVVQNNKGARRIADTIQQGQNKQSQAIDVGQIQDKGYEEKKHLATLNYGQSPGPKDIAPSVQTKVDDKVQLFSKPIASLFAWHKCGLIVPVYPGMRALLAHNQNLTNDAIVTGFLWPDQPEYARPKNEPGDYWLCLPTALDGNNQPTGKGVNDLTDKSGLRVIQAKGLHIYVGKDSLPDVGERPPVPKEKTIVIEHESGTTITIADDGTVKIETKGKDISLTNGQGTLKLEGSGDISLQNSGVTMKLGSSGVEVK